MDMDWIAIEPVHRKTVLGIHLSEERNMFVAERILSRPLYQGMENM
jgi:hypothetical protein